MTEHKIIKREPLDFSAPGGDNRRILMKDYSPAISTKDYYGSQVPCLDDMARVLIGQQNSSVGSVSSYLGNSTWTVAANWTNQWNYLGMTPNTWGGSAITVNAFYEIFVEGWIFSASPITFAWFGLRVDQGTTLVTETQGGAAFSTNGTTNHWAIRYHNILYLTPTSYTGGFCNVYPYFYATTSPANQVITIDGARCHIRMLSQGTQY